MEAFSQNQTPKFFILYLLFILSYCSAQVHVLSWYKVSERFFSLSFEMRGSVGNACSLFMDSSGLSVDFANLCSSALLYLYLKHVHLRGHS